MGKKNKTKDIWDLSPEEQAKQMDDLYAMESGDVNVFSLGKAKVGKGINKRGFSNGLESEIVKDFCGEKSAVVSLNEEKYNNDEPVGKTNMEEILGIKPAREEKVPHKSQPISIDEPSEDITVEQKATPVLEVKNKYLRQIKFYLNKKFHRLILDDGIAPSSFSFDIGLTTELQNNHDDAEVADVIPDLMLYIISLKHPTAIYEYDDFVNRDYWKFASVKNGVFDLNKYIFLTNDEYVFCYLIDEESVREFTNFIDELNYGADDILRTYISLAYNVGTLHEAFFTDDSSYIKLLMKSDKNNQKEFHKLFTNDLSITFVPNGEELGEDDGIHMYNIDDLQSYTREMIGKFTGSSYFNDDDEDWDESDDDDESSDDYDMDTTNEEPYEETSNEEYPSEEDYVASEEETEVSDLLSEDMEVVKEAETPKKDIRLAANDDDEDFIVDVVRKNK